MADNKSTILRRYLEQNNFRSMDDPITMQQGVELERLKALYDSPTDFRREVLKWEAEQKEKTEKERKQVLDKAQAERERRFYSGDTASGQIALAKGKQAQMGIEELRAIKADFERLKEQRARERMMALEGNLQTEQKENWRAAIEQSAIDAFRQLNMRERIQRETEARYRSLYDPEALAREYQQVNLSPQPKPTRKEPDIPMAPPTNKRRIKLRD